MKKPQKEDYGWNEETGWTQGDKARFEYDVKTWEIVRPKLGKQRIRPIHPSWSDYVAHFNPNDPTRSQGAFCRWAGIRSSSLSAAKNKPITDKMELKLSEWIEELEKQEPNEQQ